MRPRRKCRARERQKKYREKERDKVRSRDRDDDDDEDEGGGGNDDTAHRGEKGRTARNAARGDCKLGNERAADKKGDRWRRIRKGAKESEKESERESEGEKRDAIAAIAAIAAAAMLVVVVAATVTAAEGSDEVRSRDERVESNRSLARSLASVDRTKLPPMPRYRTMSSTHHG